MIPNLGVRDELEIGLGAKTLGTKVSLGLAYMRGVVSPYIHWGKLALAQAAYWLCALAHFIRKIQNKHETPNYNNMQMEKIL